MRDSTAPDAPLAAEPRVRRAGPRCLVICGPTAAGKTPLAAALGAELDLLVVSADSRQIYRGFDIGTAKPSHADQARTPHACLDLVEPTTRFTAYAWAAAAQEAIACASRVGRLPVVVGGAGFYIRALVHPVAPGAPAGTERLEAHYLVLDPGVSLRQRIADRIAMMVNAGWPAEVEALALRVPPEAPAWQGCGYAAMRRYVEGSISLSSAIEETTVATRQYAKRQRTWFRHQLPADRTTHLNPDDPAAVERALGWIRRLSPNLEAGA